MKKYEIIAVCVSGALIVFTAGFFAGRTLAPRQENTVVVYEQKSGGDITLPLGSGENAKLNLNSASYDELCALPGIGPELASKILAYRQLNGGFEAVEELENINGISRNTISKLCDLVDCY